MNPVTIVESVVHTWEERAPGVSAGPISLSVLVLLGSIVIAWLSRLFLLSLYALGRWLNGKDIRTTWWWLYLCCCSRKRRHGRKPRHRKKETLPTSSGFGGFKKGPQVESHEGGINNRRFRRKRNPFRNIYHLFVLFVGIGIVFGGIIWALHIVEAPASLLVSLGVVGYVIAQAASPTIGNVICGIIIYAYDLVEIGEFISLRDGRRGYVEELSPFWVVLDDPADDHVSDQRIFVNNKDVISGFSQYPFHDFVEV